MWLLGATTEKQRKALADYFSPTLIRRKALVPTACSVAHQLPIPTIIRTGHPTQTGTRSLTIPKDAKGGPKATTSKADDEARVLHR